MKISKRLKIMMKHRDLIKHGEYDIAWVLLRLLHRGNIMLGLGDADFAAERILEKLGCAISYHHRRYLVTVYDFGQA